MAHKVLLLIDKLETGGAQRQFVNLASNLDRARFEPFLFCLEKGGPFEEPLADMGIPVRTLGVKRVYDFNAPARLAGLADFVRAERVDLVHTWMFLPNVLGPPAAKIGGARAVVTSRRDTGFWQKHRHYAMLKASGRFVDAVVANSTAVKNAALKNENLSPRKVKVVPNGLEFPDKASIPGRDSDAPVIGTVGSLKPQKNHDFFLDAAAKLKTAFPDARFVIHGEGPERERLQEKARLLGISEILDMPGETRDVFGALRDMTLFFLPSKTEGFPNVLLEAMAAGLPCVASNVGGVPEIIDDNRLGRLVSSGDVPAAVKTISYMLLDSALRKEIGSAASAHVRSNYSARVMAEKYESLYDELLDKGRAS